MIDKSKLEKWAKSKETLLKLKLSIDKSIKTIKEMRKRSPEKR